MLAIQLGEACEANLADLLLLILILGDEFEILDFQVDDRLVGGRHEQRIGHLERVQQRLGSRQSAALQILVHADYMSELL